ncbi:MAG: PolC-type DNA polymerase III [Gemmatimonadota bacterium]
MSLRGMDFSPDSPLVARALNLLEAAPCPTGALAKSVFGLTNAPPGLAARLVYDLLGTDRRVVVNEEGVWRLASPGDTRMDASLAALEYAVVDVETTGRSPATGGRIMEIACVHVSRGEIVGEFSSLVNPRRPISPWVSRLTGITDAMVATAPRFEELCEALCGRLRGRVFVAHNAAFDWSFLATELRLARALLPTGPRLCTVRLARRAIPGLRRRGLDALARYYGVEIRGRHRAVGDALATAAVLLRLLREADRKGVRSWGELQRWLAGQRPGIGQRPSVPPGWRPGSSPVGRLDGASAEGDAEGGRCS